MMDTADLGTLEDWRYGLQAGTTFGFKNTGGIAMQTEGRWLWLPISGEKAALLSTDGRYRLVVVVHTHLCTHVHTHAYAALLLSACDM